MPPQPAPLAVLALLALAAGEAEGSAGIMLKITSPEDALAFAASCTVTGPEGERTERFERTTPLELAFETAHGLSCRIESAGSLDVTARGPGGNLSRARTTGGTIALTVGR